MSFTPIKQRIYFPFFMFSIEEMKANDHLENQSWVGLYWINTCFQLILCNVLMKAYLWIKIARTYCMF